jgi:hypothetical protein
MRRDVRRDARTHTDSQLLALASPDICITTVRGLHPLPLSVSRVGIRRHYSLGICVLRAMDFCKACAVASNAANAMTAIPATLPAQNAVDWDLGALLQACAFFATSRPC